MTVMEKENTKARLLEAAGEEFAAKGFEAVSIRAICDRIGANCAAVNYHFGSKEQLYVEAVIEAHRCGAGPLPEAEFDRLGPADQLRAYVGHFLRNVVGVCAHPAWHQTLLLRELVRPTRASEVLVRDAIRPKFDRLSRILRSVCPEADDRKLHALAFSVIGQCLHYRIAREVSTRLVGPEAYAALDLEYLTEHISAFSLAALGLAPPVNAVAAERN